MALFKIAKGDSSNLSKNRPTAQEGFCYLTTDDMKFYVDLTTNNSLTNNLSSCIYKSLDCGEDDSLGLSDTGSSEMASLSFLNHNLYLQLKILYHHI